MRAVIQRVSRASVKVDGAVVGAIGRGLLVLLGVAGDDAARDIEYIVEKIVSLRICEDAEGRMIRLSFASFQHTCRLFRPSPGPGDRKSVV